MPSSKNEISSTKTQLKDYFNIFNSNMAQEQSLFMACFHTASRRGLVGSVLAY